MYNSAPLFVLPEPRKCNFNLNQVPQPANLPASSCILQEGECIPFGYQPKQPNPGQLKFHYINYPFPALDGKLKQHPGKGWNTYGETGEYYLYW